MAFFQIVVLAMVNVSDANDMLIYYHIIGVATKRTLRLIVWVNIDVAMFSQYTSQFVKRYEINGWINAIR